MCSGARLAVVVFMVASPAVLLGCGSAGVGQLPPAAGPPRDVAALAGGRTVTLLGRERVLELRDARGRRLGRAPAGVGPTHVACVDRAGQRAWCYVTDARGNALLVFAVNDGIAPARRYYLAGGPDGVSVDHARRRLLVTLRASHAVVELAAHGRPHVLRR
jgi:hypothetical protein